MRHTIIALYDNFEDARDAMEALVDAGINKADISFVSSDIRRDYSPYIDDDVKSGEGAGFGAVVGTLAGLATALIPGVGLAFGAGALALSAGIGAATGAVTGGLVAGLIDSGVPEADANYYAEGIRRGGAMVSVQVDEANTARAEHILNEFEPINMDDRADYYRSTGWSRYDPKSTAFSEDALDEDRNRYYDFSSGNQPPDPNTVRSNTRRYGGL